MNAPVRKIVILPRSVLLAAVVAVVLSGCVGAFDPRTDATSPLAPRIQALVDANREYPRWSDFPRDTAPPPPAAQVGQRVAALKSTGSGLSDEVARLEWLSDGDAEGFARDVRARVDAVPVAPVTQETQAEIDAFARRLRERGRAPPPIDRRD